jgi:hypothetical protein
LNHSRREVRGTNTQQKGDHTPEKKFPASKEKKSKRPHLKSEEENPPRRSVPKTRNNLK